MKKNTEKIDELIKEALSKEEAAFYDSLDEQGLLEQVWGLYKGKLSWLLWIMNIVMILFFAVFVYSAVRFFDTEVTNELIKWATIGFVSLLAVSMLKLFAWMQMDKNALLREIKRLEIQISSLANQQNDI